jgi:hypothetical protein
MHLRYDVFRVSQSFLRFVGMFSLSKTYTFTRFFDYLAGIGFSDFSNIGATVRIPLTSIVTSLGRFPVSRSIQSSQLLGNVIP